MVNEKPQTPEESEENIQVCQRVMQTTKNGRGQKKVKET